MSILCAGLIVCDVIVSPVPKDVMYNDSSRIDTLKMASGGDALNVAVVLAKLGVSVSLCGMAGVDAFGNFVADEVKRAGVDTSTIIRNSEYATSTSIVLIENGGERHFAYYGKTNDELKAEDILKCDFNKYRHLHIGSAMALKSLDGEGLRDVLKYAKDEGLTTSFDVTWDSDGVWLDKIKSALYYCDYFLPSFEESQKISGCESIDDMKAFYSQFNIKRLVIKMGEAGSFATDFTNEYYTPIIKKGEVVDTTGAGDCYAGGFLCATYHGLDLRESAIFATAVASDCVTQYGANAGVKPLSETVEYLSVNKMLSCDDIAKFNVGE